MNSKTCRCILYSYTVLNPDLIAMLVFFFYVWYNVIITNYLQLGFLLNFICATEELTADISFSYRFLRSYLFFRCL